MTLTNVAVATYLHKEEGSTRVSNSLRFKKGVITSDAYEQYELTVSDYTRLKKIEELPGFKFFFVYVSYRDGTTYYAVVSPGFDVSGLNSIDEGATFYSSGENFNVAPYTKDFEGDILPGPSESDSYAVTSSTPIYANTDISPFSSLVVSPALVAAEIEVEKSLTELISEAVEQKVIQVVDDLKADITESVKLAIEEEAVTPKQSNAVLTSAVTSIVANVLLKALSR